MLTYSQRERERERERETDRQTQTETERHIETETARETESDSDDSLDLPYNNYDIDRRIYRNLSKSVQSTAGLNLQVKAAAANGRYLT